MRNLIQHLFVPRGISCNPFGGGLHYGGFSEEGFKLLHECFRFGYMGAAEFEHGAVPQAIDRICSKWSEYEMIHLDNYGSMDDLQEREACSELYKLYLESQSQTPTPVPPLFAICKRSQMDIFAEIIDRAWQDDYSFKEATGLRYSVLTKAVKPDWDQDVPCGWLVCDEESFFFFLDSPMCLKTMEFFNKNHKMKFSIV